MKIRIICAFVFAALGATVATSTAAAESSTTAAASTAVATATASATISEPESSEINNPSADFAKRMEAFRPADRPDVFSPDITPKEREALQFLYAYMPLPDLTDYSLDFYLDNVRCSFEAREQMPWGKTVPEREFRHFVLPVRVNNENLDESRMVFYKELKDRVSGLSMYDAALEVNHWCHEKATYKPSDSRTSSPLATVRTAYGRCGEESTFTVAAMRAVGIPARQVYTPRWAHTDDNHAWVEVWVDGSWHFLGACEPEPVLDLGWFNAPASRGMLMHTNVFGKYDGPEEVVSNSACYTEINVTQNYAPVATTYVKTIDAKGRPVSAEVEFKLYNYGELFTVSRKHSDSKGITHLTSGLGDMIIWANADGRTGIAKCSAGKTDTITIKIDKRKGFKGTMEFDIVPPPQRNTVPQLTKEQISENQARLAVEDSIRNAYTATFISSERARRFAAEQGTDEAETERLLTASRGNWMTLTEFISNASDKDKAVRLLKVISEKDLRDVSIQVLEDHLNCTHESSYGNPLYDKYVMNPRVSDEMLTPYKSALSAALGRDAEKYRANPLLWADWCAKNIVIDKDWNPKRLKMHPESVWKLRVTDKLSREIFFVAGARSMGIAARVDEVTGKVQYAGQDGDWHDVDLSAAVDGSSEKTMNGATNAPTGTLTADYAKRGRLDNPKYYSHFTLSRIENGKAILLNYPEDESWERLLKNGTTVDAGDYLLTSGTRMADGSVLAKLSFFNVGKGKNARTSLVMREDNDKVQVIGNFNSENLYYDSTSESTKSLLSTTGRGYYVLGLIKHSDEPTNHALTDIAAYSEDFERWGGKIMLLFEDQQEAGRFRAKDFANLPSTVSYGTDIDRTIISEITNALNLPSDSRPIFIVADTFNRVVFVSQGYTIGLGEQLMKILHGIGEL